MSFGFLLPACDKDEASDSQPDLNLVCGSSMPSGFQCISHAGASTPTTYQISELVGSWNSDDFDFCVRYNSDGSGRITFPPSGLNPGGSQRIKWGAMVSSKGELLKSGQGTIYIVHESLDGSLDPQIASLSFKRDTRQWYGFDLVSVTACGSGGGGGGGGGGATGNVTFWAGHGQTGMITVNINGASQNITQSRNATPPCGSTGCANFSGLPVGSYSYSVSGGQTGTGTVTVTDGGCESIQSSFPINTGNTTTGDVIFWTDQILWPLSISMTGPSGAIGGGVVTLPQLSSAPTCGSTSGDNFVQMRPGTYTYTVTFSDGSVQTGTVNVVVDACSVVRL